MRKFLVRIEKKGQGPLTTIVTGIGPDEALTLARMQYRKSLSISLVEEIGNPVETLARLHNRALDAFAAEPGFPDNRDPETVHEFASRFFASEFDKLGLRLELPGLDQVNEVFELIDATDADLEEIASRLVEDGSIEQRVAEELSALDDHLTGLCDKDILNFRLVGFEASIQRRQDLSPSEKSIILGTSAVARNSGEYWFHVENDIESPWHEPAAKEPKKPRKRRRFLKFLKRAAADAFAFGATSSLTGLPGLGVFVASQVSIRT